MIIVFEGYDSTSKTTHGKNLVDFLTLKGRDDVINLVFPERSTFLGKLIDDYLEGKISLNPRTSHLLFSANRWEFYDTLKKGKDKIIIIDRYYFSGVVYTKSLDDSISVKWLEKMDEGLPEPDLVFYLYKDEFNAEGKEIYDDLDFSKKVKKNYEELYVSKKENWIPINTSGPTKKVFEDVLNEFKKKILSV